MSLTLLEHLRLHVPETAWPENAQWIALDSADGTAKSPRATVKFFESYPSVTAHQYSLTSTSVHNFYEWSGEGESSYLHMIPEHRNCHMWAFSKEQFLAINIADCNQKAKEEEQSDGVCLVLVAIAATALLGALFL